jgi:hypothetical protein
MRSLIALAVCVGLIGIAPIGTVQARDLNVAPKKDIDPWDKSRVTRVEARNWVERAPDRGGLMPSEKKNCQTNIASAPQPPQQQRFGPGNGTASKSDQVVVVKGNVINVCK